MKLLVRDNKIKEWKIVEPIRTKVEAELQKLLVESPSLIPIDEIREISQLLNASLLQTLKQNERLLVKYWNMLPIFGR